MVDGQPAALVPSLLCTMPEEPRMPRLQRSWNSVLLPYGVGTIPSLQLHDTKPRLRMSLSPGARTAWLLLAMGCWEAPVSPGCSTNSGLKATWSLLHQVSMVHRDDPLSLELNTL